MSQHIKANVIKAECTLTHFLRPRVFVSKKDKNICVHTSLFNRFLPSTPGNEKWISEDKFASL